MRNSLFLANYGLAICLGLAVNLSVSADELSDSEQKLEQITTNLAKIKRELASDRKSHQKLVDEMADLDKEVQYLYKGLQSSQSKLDSIKIKQQQLSLEKDQIEAQLSNQNLHLQKQIRLSYLSNQQSQWHWLVNTTSLTDLGTQRVMHEYVNSARLNEISKLVTLDSKLDQTNSRLAEQQSQLQQVVAEQKRQQTVLKKARQQKEQAQLALSQSIGTTENRLKRELDKQKALQRLIKKLSVSKNVNPFGSFAKAKGKLAWPVSGKILNKFGGIKNRESNIRWDGVATAAPRGADVRAIYGGKVIFADYLKGFGWLLIIDHGNEFMSLYSHAEALTKEVGDVVEIGEVVALVGDSGNVNTPTMYFEIRRQGSPVNPEIWCKKPELAYAL